MDIKELDKKQLVLLTFLITFVVSIATGIVTVSLMNQAPKSVPQTINNVIQRTIEKVSTVENTAKEEVTSGKTQSSSNIPTNGDEALVPIYSITENSVSSDPTGSTNVTVDNLNTTTPAVSKELGQGIIISDIGLILVDSSILNESQNYKVVLNKTDFNASVLKKFNNGFTILKISEKKVTAETPVKTDTTKATQ